jgi:hypothetical protein
MWSSLPTTLHAVLSSTQFKKPATDAFNCITARSHRLPSTIYAQIIILHSTNILYAKLQSPTSNDEVARTGTNNPTPICLHGMVLNEEDRQYDGCHPITFTISTDNQIF